MGSPWNTWGTTAWSFHQRARDAPFLDPSTGSADAYLSKIIARPRPPGIRPPASDRILLLPRVRTPLAVPYREVLERRRTYQTFTEHVLLLDHFSDLLHYSFAPLRFVDAGPLGVLQLRTSASAGARHETEAFVVVFSVADVEPGLYHYDNIRHGLVPIRHDVGRDHLERVTYHQGLFQHASFAVLTVAIAERLSWKYPHPRAYRMLLQNVGHVAQVFSMTAAALDLGAGMTGAIRDSEVDRLLGLAEPGEFTTFALACGRSVDQPRPPRQATDNY